LRLRNGLLNDHSVASTSKAQEGSGIGKAGRSSPGWCGGHLCSGGVELSHEEVDDR